MLTKFSYSAIMKAVFIIGLLACVLIGWEIYVQGPRVRYVRPDSSFHTAAYTRGSSLTVQFDRPIKAQEYQSAIRFEPAIDFTLATGAQSLQIAFNETLQHNQQYTLTIDQQIIDTTGRQMRDDFHYTFRTSPADFAVLQRVNPNDLDGYVDKIVTTDLSGQESVVLQASEIRTFTASQDYIVAVAARNDENDALFVYDRHTKTTRTFDTYIGGRIAEIEVAPRGKTLLFRVDPPLESVSKEFYEQYVGRVYSLELETFSLIERTHTDESALRASEISFSYDGRRAVIRDQLSQYTIVSPYNDFDPIFMGLFTKSYGFAFFGREIIMLDNGRIISFDSQTGESVERQLATNSFVLGMYARERTLFTAATQFGTTRDVTITKQQSWEDTPEPVWQLPVNVRFNEVVPSYDDRLLAIQLDPQNCEFDDRPINGQCIGGQTIIVDVKSGQTVQNLDGIDPVWLP